MSTEVRPSDGRAALGLRWSGRLAARGALILVAAWVVVGGFSYPLGLELSTWPWNRSWFMFSEDDGSASHLAALGVLADGTREEIDVRPWFRVIEAALSRCLLS